MTQIAAKLVSHDIAPPQADRSVASGTSTLPLIAIVSVAIHGLVALGLVALPMPSCDLRELDATWVSFDLAPLPAAAPALVPDPVVVPPAPEPEQIVRRDRPIPTAVPAPEVIPEPQAAPPSIDDVFAEPAPAAAVLTGEGPSAFAVAPGELGGIPGGVPGGHGTSLVSAVRPTLQATGRSEADRRRARRGYVHAIEDLVRAHTHYPRAAAREGLQGRVELALRIATDGRVLAIRVANSSGHVILDESAVAAAREIDRVPSPPAAAALTSADEVRVGVVYVVR